ncbi:MAG: hypothetical protein ACTSVD_02555 [Candidatus Thorarchaeota archaeon]|nr:MAG: hypothetical protein DRO73_05965 [Candidatus Thorarchaeota archaeon]
MGSTDKDRLSWLEEGSAKVATLERIASRLQQLQAVVTELENMSDPMKQGHVLSREEIAEVTQMMDRLSRGIISLEQSMTRLEQNMNAIDELRRGH